MANKNTLSSEKTLTASAGKALITLGLLLPLLWAKPSQALVQGHNRFHANVDNSLFAPRATSFAIVNGIETNGFTVTGHIEKFILDTPSDIRSAAKMTVNGIEIIIPKNTEVVMPGAYFTPQELFFEPLNQKSGLAIADSNKPTHQMFEASIVGNTVNGKYIAGLVNITPQALNNSDGFIKRINRTTGELCVGASPAQLTGNCVSPNIRVRLNDPTGRFGMPQTGTDLRFQLDPDNQPIMASTSYPMCIPRPLANNADDPLCPAKNRPAITSASGGADEFVMSTAPILAGSINKLPNINIPACSACDPSVQAPLKVGDFVSFAGLLMKDDLANNNPYYVSAYALNTNVGIYTKPGGPIAYIMQEDSHLAVGPTSNCPALGECLIRVRLLGFTTDPSRVDTSNLKQFHANLYAVDVGTDGVRRLRLMQQGSLATPKKEAFFGRFRFDVQIKFPALSTNLLVPTPGGATRETVVKLDTGGIPLPNGTPLLTDPNKLVPGQYVIPQPEFIFPELAHPGSDALASNFQCLAFLAQGWTTGSGPAGAPLTLGPLDPWPGAVNPNGIVDCTNP